MTTFRSLEFRTTRTLRAIDPQRRQQIRDLPDDLARHASILRDLPLFGELEEVPPNTCSTLPTNSIRVTAWNAERCKFLGDSAALLERSGGDLHLLCEMDYGMARSGQGHNTQELAMRTGCGYLFGVEWLELDIGDERERILFRGQQNKVGFHGNAILSKRQWKRPVLIRLETDGYWFDSRREDRRVGGRMAVAATFDVGGVDVAFAAVHLEAHSDPQLRARQMRALFDGIEAYSRGGPVVIGGDLNTTSLERRFINRKDHAAPAVSPPELMKEDPLRLVDPVRYEPLFELATASGYDWRMCNRLGVLTQRTRLDGTPPPPLGKLDWFLTRGVVATDPQTIAALGVDGKTAISDHELLIVTVAPDRETR